MLITWASKSSVSESNVKRAGLFDRFMTASLPLPINNCGTLFFVLTTIDKN